MVENYNAQNEIEKGKPSQEIDKKLASKIIFNSAFKAINEEFKNLGSKGTEIIFNKIASGNFDIDNQKKSEKTEIIKSITQYINDPLNKEHILNLYINKGINFPQWISQIITNKYSYEDMGEYELNSYFPPNCDIIALGKNIIGPDRDGENIHKFSELTCPFVIISDKQFIQKFNEINDIRKNQNITMMENIDFKNINVEDLGVCKRKGKLYIGDGLVTNELLLSDQKILDYIKNSTKFNYVTYNEFKNDLHYIKNDQLIILKNKLNAPELKDEDENYNLHESGLNFYKEYKLLDKQSILHAYEDGDLEKLEKKHNKLPEIMNLLEIQEDDIPDLRDEKARLIYLLNHGLFRSFQLEVGAIDSNLSMFDTKAELGGTTLNALEKKIKWYESEKSPEFFQLLEDIKNINVDIDGVLQNPEISKELNNKIKIQNVNYVIDMFKSVFIQRLKNGDCNYEDPSIPKKDHKNIDTFKHQIAYILATLHHECRYEHDAHTNGKSYYGFGQVHSNYTTFWTKFIQGSGIQFENRNSKDINFVGQPEGLLDREISRFAFVYGLSYGLFSSGGNLDKYIYDGETDYEGARNIEAGAGKLAVANTAKIWDKYIK